MGTKELLEQDRDRLIHALTGAASGTEAAAVLEEEVSRILYRCNEKDGTGRAGEETLYALQTLRAALPLVDSSGEVLAYRHEKKAEPAGKEAVLPGAAGGALSLAALLLPSLPGRGAMLTALPLSVLLLAGGLFLVFFAGRRSVPAAGGSHKGDPVTYEVRPDSERIYNCLLNALSVVDRNVEEARRLSEDTGDQTELDKADREEIELMADLLEQLCAETEADWAAEMDAQIRFYLHKKGIEAVNYTPEHAAWFDRMPGRGKATLRPALVRDGVPVKKGLAAG